MKNEFPLTSWSLDGFAEPPEEREVKGGEIVYRAYGGSSGELGNCFFAPAVESTPLGFWTAELLEHELNAALWGNDFEGLIKYRMHKREGAMYRIGPVAHDGYAGVDGGVTFFQRSFITPSGIFKQVRFVLDEGQDMRTVVMECERFRLKTGRYARGPGAKAWH